jgi:hypothetical protein
MELDNTNKYGTLLTNDIKLYRHYFNEMVKLLGINVIYRSPKIGKTYTTYAEIDSNYNSPMLVGCIFDEHPTQQTLKRIGWMSELQQNSSIIHVAYDLPNLQQGSLFVIPSGLDNGKGRLFRVVKLTNSIVYPASITCELVPEYEDTFDKSSMNFKHTSLNLLVEEEEHL